MKLYKILYEGLPQPEANKKDIFGQYLFAPNRKIPEPNTDAEENLEDGLASFFSHPKNSHTVERFASTLLDLLSKHKYEPLLDPGDIRVYRGMYVDVEFIEELLKPYQQEIQYGRVVIVNHPDVLEPNDRWIQSWSKKADVATNFAYERRGPAIIFVARTNAEGNKFFGKPEKLAVAVKSENLGEYETISVGPVEYDGFVYYVGSKYNPDEPDFSKENHSEVESELIAAAKKVH